jgi:hypothetical protein
MGQASRPGGQSDGDGLHRTDQRNDQRRDLFGNGHDAGPAARQRSAALVGLRIRYDGDQPGADGAQGILGPTNIASNLTFASLPLTLMGSWARWYANQDKNPSFDLADIKKDIDYLQFAGQPPVDWRWYQNGYDHEPTDPTPVATHTNYVSHHSGPQYFGYVANNPSEQTKIRGEGDFFTDIANNALPQGGVFYIRGGYYNLNYPARGAVIQNPNYPDPAGLTSRTGHDQRRQIRRRRSPGLFRQPAQRSDGGAYDQRDRQQSANLESERHRHHLRRVRRPL